MENIGKLTTPDGNGASIEVSDKKVYINNTLRADNIQAYGDNISCINDTSFIRINGGSEYTHGSHLLLTGKDFNNGVQDYLGLFELCARNDNYNYALIGKADKNATLAWNGKIVDTIHSFGTNHIQYTNGLLIQWNTIRIESGLSIINTFTIPFVDTSYACIPIYHTTQATANSIVAVSKTDKSYITIYRSSDNTSSSISYIAIGRWK